MQDYDPDTDGGLLHAGEVARLLHVSTSHLRNLRAAGTLRGYRMAGRGWWRYPSRQPVLDEARAALRGER
jgi:hypothetical protein